MLDVPHQSSFTLFYTRHKDLITLLPTIKGGGGNKMTDVQVCKDITLFYLFILILEEFFSWNCMCVESSVSDCYTLCNSTT